jgi:hypothetical protein
MRHRHQVGAKCGQIGQALRGRGVALVGQVIGRAREAVDGDDGRPQRRRAQQRRDREIFVMFGTHRTRLSTLAARCVPGR